MTTQLARNDACRVPKGRRGRDGGGDDGAGVEEEDGGAKVDKVAKTPSLPSSHAGAVARSVGLSPSDSPFRRFAEPIDVVAQPRLPRGREAAATVSAR